MWGFNHLIFLPGTFTYLYIIMACMALILPFTGLAVPLMEKTFNRFTYIFFESPKRLVFRLLFTFVMTALFVFYAMPTHFLGDGYTVIDILAHTCGTIHKWSEAGTTIVLGTLQSILGEKSEHTARSAFQIVSVLSGLISVWFFFLIAGQISEEKEKRVLAFVVSVCSGALLLFFGYVENYPMLWIALSGFVYFGLKRLNTGHGLLPAFLFLAGGIFLHLQTAIFVPAFVYLLIARGNGLKFYGGFKPTGGINLPVC
jgi:hypothetical protein